MSTLFLFFIFLQVFTSTFIFFSINPIHSILLLILLFFESSIVLSLFSLEFVSILFIIIYVGAIAILFLFVIMMLQLKLNNLEVLFFFPIILSINILIFFFFLHYSYPFFFLLYSKVLVYDESFNELFIIGQFLYNYSIICFLLAGIILLLALLGSIIISLDFNKLRYNIIFKKLNRVSNFISFLR
jgi:NADH-quinone oxidoreductase subunit J